MQSVAGQQPPLPPLNSLPPLPISCRALEDCEPKSLSRSCVWRRRTHKAQQTIAKHLHGHTQCDEFVRNQNRIKGQKVHITRREKGQREREGEGARTSFCYLVEQADFHTLRHISRARVAVAETITAERTFPK